MLFFYSSAEIQNSNKILSYVSPVLSIDTFDFCLKDCLLVTPHLKRIYKISAALIIYMSIVRNKFQERLDDT